MELSYEQSQEQAVHLKTIQAALMKMDVTYLEEAFKQMEEQHSMRASAMILDPNPFTALERNDLEAAKLKQLELYLEAAKNLQEIANAELKVMQAKAHSQDLGKMFGL